MTPLCGWLLVLLSSPLWHSEGVHAWGGVSTVPSESECRPYIDKALKQLSPHGSQEAVDATGSEQETTPTQSTHQEGSIDESEEATTKESIESNLSIDTPVENETSSTETEEVTETKEEASTEETSSEQTQQEDTLTEQTQTEENADSIESTETQENITDDIIGEEKKTEDSLEVEQISSENEQESTDTAESVEATSTEETTTAKAQSAETPDDSTNEQISVEDETKSGEESVEVAPTKEEGDVSEDLQLETSDDKSPEQNVSETLESHEESMKEAPSSAEDHSEEESVKSPGVEETDSSEITDSTDNKESMETEAADKPTENVEESVEETKESAVEEPVEETKESVVEESVEETKAADVSSGTPGAEEEASKEGSDASIETVPESETTPESTEETASKSEPEGDGEKIDATPTTEGDAEIETAEKETTEETTEEQESTASEETPKEQEPTVEDQLTLEFEVPKMRRPRDHLAEILRLAPESAETELLLAKTIEVTLKELKKLYDTAIKPLEILYKYRDLSNRHFGDPEIFSKPLILFMGPWSGGKSSIINYLLDNEFKSSSLRTGAEPSPAYFNILMWGEREEVLDGTQLAADWTFSGLQKFGQGLLDRLRGLRLNAPLLEKVNIVEIPGILEIRKQVERLFPFNDACQWFIDRADIIFLVYDPSKLDVGPETEAILDQLKGREYQTRIILNKADQVKPEELMRVQGTLIWNISPLMSSQEPPVMYSTSLWSVPYEQGAPSRLLHAQERAFLRDLRQAVEKRVENKIASARRFAVRVRNHAKMVDCYLTTYYNHKSFFGNRKKVADDIIEHPQNYHIYEGLSTLTNISRYDLPDPEVYRDFFRLNQVYDFQRLSDTCTYFRGCPINRLDVAIAYDLPELVGKWKKQAERVLDAAAAQGKS